MFARLVDIAHALFDKSWELRTFHVSFILLKGRVLSIGLNSRKTNPVNLRNRKLDRSGANISGIKGCCSELSAILKLKKETNVLTRKCKLVNIRIDRNRKLKNSKPCESCRSLLRFFEFKEIYFSTETGDFQIFDPKI